MLGAPQGTLFGVSDVAIKSASRGSAGIGEVLLSPLAGRPAGDRPPSSRSQRPRGSHRKAPAVPVIAATSTAANVSCILGGIVVFGDPMPAAPSGSAAGRRFRDGHPRRPGNAAADARRRRQRLSDRARQCGTAGQPERAFQARHRSLERACPARARAQSVLRARVRAAAGARARAARRRPASSPRTGTASGCLPIATGRWHRYVAGGRPLARPQVLRAARHPARRPRARRRGTCRADRDDAERSALLLRRARVGHV